MQIESSRAGHVGRGHRSTVPGGSSCVAADHCGLNAGTRREDIHAGAVVGKGRANVRGSGGSHSQRFADPGGRVVACVCVVIARGPHKSDPGCNGALDGSIQRSRCAAAQAHICHGWKNGFGRHPINACNHTPPRNQSRHNPTPAPDGWSRLWLPHRSCRPQSQRRGFRGRGNLRCRGRR